MQRNLWDQVDGDLYAILDVPPTATADEIVLAWRSTAKRLHPDLGGSADEFQRAEIAYEVLSDPLERRRYDRHLTSSQPPRQETGGPQFRATSGWQAQPQNTNTGWHEEDYRNPPPMKIFSWNPWLVLIALAIIVGALVAAIFFAVFIPMLLIMLPIWIIGRALNPGGRRPE